MQLITNQYCDLNKDLHASNASYGTSGQKYLNEVIDLCKGFKTQDVLDYGCGKSTLAINLPFPIKQYDPAVAKYSAMPKAADIVVCTDVLEHIEPVCLDDVLDHLKSLTLKAAFLSIATRPARKVLADGRNAHLIQRPAKWWIERLWDRFEVINFSQEEGNFNVVVINNAMYLQKNIAS